MTTNLQQRFLDFHSWVYQRSRGLVGHHVIGVSTLLLETTGRRSGTRRTSALVYARDAANFVLVASNGGSDQPPAWLSNLLARPEVQVQVARHRQSARAMVLRPGDEEYARLWSLVNQHNHHRYEGYQALTKRPLPLVVLTPR
ncbi:MAG TPA: nitroreductase/quinone reductase family protein [Candidatus Micrarchaeaceae archaeon]|nr:nitroreductase/quinone reductase family protein [Candidatus Micrarchaeaceae archaeon]